MEEREIKKVIEQGVDESIKKYLDNGVKKLNLFTILQATWLLELYYLGANVLYEFLNNNPKIMRDLNIANITLPAEVEKYNSIIKSYFTEWRSFIFFLFITMLLCGLSFLFLAYIPRVKDYKLIRGYASYGIFASRWIGLIYITYYLYANIGIFFMLVPFAIVILIAIMDELKKYLKKISIIQDLYPPSQMW